MNTAVKGVHFLIELQASAPLGIFNNVAELEIVLNTIATSSGMKVIKSAFHAFSPVGVTGILLLEESHISIHTWPEHNYAAMDFFTCNVSVDVAKLKNEIQNHFEGCWVDMKIIERGVMSQPI